MVAGLALFYGGMVRKKNVLTTMMTSFVAPLEEAIRIRTGERGGQAI